MREPRRNVTSTPVSPRWSVTQPKSAASPRCGSQVHPRASPYSIATTPSFIPPLWDRAITASRRKRGLGARFIGNLHTLAQMLCVVNRLGEADVGQRTVARPSRGSESTSCSTAGPRRSALTASASIRWRRTSSCSIRTRRSPPQRDRRLQCQPDRHARSTRTDPSTTQPPGLSRGETRPGGAGAALSGSDHLTPISSRGPSLALRKPTTAQGGPRQ